jgi:hypothetical protein
MVKDMELPKEGLPTRPKKKSGLGLIVLVVVLLVLALAGWYGYDYYRTNYGTDKAKADYEIQKTVAAVSKLIVLPTGETPVLATVKDPVALAKQQNFFQGASEGDKLLIYQQARKAIIYSPTLNKIVNVGPVVYDQNATKAVTEQTPVAPTTTSVSTSTTIKTVKKK